MQRNLITDERGFVRVYADRVRSRNGKGKGTTEIEIWFDDDHYLNVLEIVPYDHRTVNHMAEIMAVTKAATQAASAGVTKLKINTNSKFIMFSVRKYMEKWRRNGWINASGNTLAHEKELKELDLALRPLKVNWMWRDFYVDEKGFVHVYTDGACIRNGTPNAAAGIGVWFANNHYLNVSQPIPAGYPVTNQVAEILAATMAAKRAMIGGVKKMLVHTDSDYIRRSLTMWIQKWLKNGWKDAKGKPVVNKREFMELNLALRPLIVKWKLVSAHSGNYGNEKAHRLATAGARRYKSC